MASNIAVLRDCLNYGADIGHQPLLNCLCVTLEMERRLQQEAEIGLAVSRFPDNTKSQLCPLS